MTTRRDFFAELCAAVAVIPGLGWLKPERSKDFVSSDAEYFEIAEHANLTSSDTSDWSWSCWVSKDGKVSNYEWTVRKDGITYVNGVAQPQTPTPGTWKRLWNGTYGHSIDTSKLT